MYGPVPATVANAWHVPTLRGFIVQLVAGPMTHSLLVNKSRMIRKLRPNTYPL